jgi:hypothetical protein
MLSIRATTGSGRRWADQRRVTARDGLYCRVNLAPGVQVVTAGRQGCVTLVRENVVAREGVNLTLDLTMMVGAVSETVEVKGDPDHHALRGGGISLRNIESCLPVTLPAGRCRRKKTLGAAADRGLSAFLEDQHRCG